MISQEKIKDFITKFPLLLPVIKKLNEPNIDWAIGGSGCLFLLGNDREPDDVDLFIRNEQHDLANKIFGIESYTYKSPVETVINSNPEGDHAIQLTSHLEFNLDKHYEFFINSSVIQKRIPFEFEGERMFLLPPEDVLLIKGLLQRGTDMGKKDIEDVKNFMKIYRIDNSYLSQRIGELGAESRTRGIFLP